ncbi:hypothetical protein ACH495_25685 [Micromonospora sp. NPDC018662]|uniref:hypothetical protein n=1 Tax=Micromonospora sp. NPDC018662 TaxID=3364238 RepID=UPI00379EFCB2
MVGRLPAALPVPADHPRGQRRAVQVAGGGAQDRRDHALDRFTLDGSARADAGH